MRLRRNDYRWLVGLPLVLVLFGFATTALAQQAPSPAPPAEPSHRRTPVSFFTTLARESVVFPDIATSERQLSPRQKFGLFVGNSISISTLVSSAGVAGIAQASNSPEGYGQGGEGYAKRFGAAMARNASSNFFGTFLLASLLHEDPRFFPQKDPTLGGSLKYSVQRVFETRSDTGSNTANWSGLLGPLFAEGLANTYWPQNERSAGDTLQRYGLDMANVVAYNIVRNYWPVLMKRMRVSHAQPRIPRQP